MYFMNAAPHYSQTEKLTSSYPTIRIAGTMTVRLNDIERRQYLPCESADCAPSSLSRAEKKRVKVGEKGNESQKPCP